jgi:polyvinyl alcohol dehydrogenase (cytochrome)
MLKTIYFLLLLGPLVAVAEDASGAGANLYKKRCASCHESGTVRLPPRSQMQDLTTQAILKILENGVMQKQGAPMSHGDRVALAQWLGRKTSAVVDTNQLTNLCQKDVETRGLDPMAAWTSWGGGVANRRFQPGGAAQLTASDTSQLKLKWAFAVPNATSMRSQPVVYNGRIIVAGGNLLYSLDARSGCTYWAAELPVGARSGITIGAAGSKELIFFGDHGGHVQAVDFDTGKAVWQSRMDEHPTSMVTGTPVYYDEKLYVPVASYEEGAAVSPDYVCCTFRGSVLAVDAATGRVLWKTYTVQEPDAMPHMNNRGAKSTGPSGVGVWSAPTIDEEKGLLYVTTGDNYSDPVTDKSDGLMALSMETGAIEWWKQFRSGDAFNNACMNAANKNCPDAKGPDFDFGSSSIMVGLPNGRRALILAQKSGTVYAVDPDHQGEVIWHAQIGKGGVLGGIEWGAAADGGRLYAALSDEAFLESGKENDLDPNIGGGMFALNLEDGERAWEMPANPCDAHRPCSPAQQAAVTVIPGVVFSGSMDGHLRAYGTDDGEVLWDYDTAHEYKTVNEAEGRGGSLDVAGPVIAGGMVFAVSGYDQAGAAPGNMLLAFSVEGN